MLKMDAIPIFSDNYVWLLQRGARAVVVDPGDARPVLQELERRGLALEAILITHWHPDHIGGLPALRERYPAPVYGPRAEADKIPGLTRLLDDADKVHVLELDFEVISVPGHTLGHIAYRAGEILLCGDTLFSAGCGRLFEGTPQQMHASLSRLAALPGDTRVYCTHEYTTSNLAFAHAVEPDNPAVVQRTEQVRALRSSNLPSLPSTIADERRFNPFLRCTETAVIEAAQQHSQQALLEPEQVFTALRKWKDSYRA